MRVDEPSPTFFCGLWMLGLGLRSLRWSPRVPRWTAEGCAPAATSTTWPLCGTSPDGYWCRFEKQGHRTSLSHPLSTTSLSRPMSASFSPSGSSMRCTKLWLFRSCSPLKVVGILFVPQRQNLMVQTIQRIIEILQLPLVFRWSMSLLCWSCRFSGAAVEKTAFLLVGKPRCSASWLVWLTYTVLPRHRCAWLVLLVTTQLALCRSDVYGGFWKNLLYFLRVRGPRSRGRFSP